jgi:hypothetical protein
MTGPLTRPPSDLKEILKKKDEALYNWLEKALVDN